MKFSSFLACFVVAVICQALHAQDRVVQPPADQVLLDRTPAPVPTLISPGDMLPPWQPGMLDIHQISTGRGNAGFYILPDDTTLLVDAGEMPTKTAAHTPDRPDNARPAGERIARYIRHFLPPPGGSKLDYAIMTHFHDDHMGGPTQQTPVASNGTYRLSGITYIGEHFKIGKLIDRGWPDYAYPKPLKDPATTNYAAFAKWQHERKGVKVERFAAGGSNQVVLMNNPGKYPAFRFQNVGVNGEIWTGQGTNTQKHFPEIAGLPAAQVPHENMCSISFRISYGNFDFFNGGDIPGVVPKGKSEWHDVETPVAKAVGPVDAAILNHHGYLDSMNAFFVSTLRPRVWTLSVWDRYHPTPGVWERLHSEELYPGPRSVFATDVHPANREEIPGLKSLASDAGHIVIRVAPGGSSYSVFILDHNQESYRVTKIFGPWEAR